jgi:hypothetical protein
MSCDITLGRKENCKNSIGGLDAIYFINYDGKLADEAVYDATDTDMIDSFGTTVRVLYKYELKGENNFAQSINSDRNAGTTFFEQVLELQLKGLGVKAHKEIKLLAWGRPYIIVRNRNKQFFIFGLNRGMEVTGGSIMSGSAMGDRSGYDLTFTGEEELPANFLDVTTEAALLAIFPATSSIVAGV